MGIRLNELIKKPRLFRQLTTISTEEFTQLLDILEPEWKEAEYHRKAGKPNRKNKPGQGHPYFADFGTILLLVTTYLHTNCGNVFLALLFGIDEQTVYDLHNKVLPLLSHRFVPQTKLRKRKPRGTINTIDEFLEAYPDMKDIIADGVEIQTRRPKRKQGKNYSGKSKKHGKKSVVLVNPTDGIITTQTQLRPGSIHDKRVLDEDVVHTTLDKLTELTKRADSAWTGEDESLGWLVNRRARRNHPLTEEEKKQNRKLSKIRIKVEHAIRRIKVFQRVGSKTSFRQKGKLDISFLAAISLANFKQIARFQIQA